MASCGLTLVPFLKTSDSQARLVNNNHVLLWSNRSNFLQYIRCHWTVQPFQLNCCSKVQIAIIELPAESGCKQGIRSRTEMKLISEEHLKVCNVRRIFCFHSTLYGSKFKQSIVQALLASLSWPFHNNHLKWEFWKGFDWQPIKWWNARSRPWSLSNSLQFWSMFNSLQFRCTSFLFILVQFQPWIELKKKNRSVLIVFKTRTSANHIQNS